MTVKLKCPVCGSIGTLMQKTTKTKTTTGEHKKYRYWYIYHGKKAKKPWCYLSKENLERPEIKRATEGLATQTTTQTSPVTTQNISTSMLRKNNLKLGSIQQKKTQRHLAHSQKRFQNEASGELDRFFQTT